MQQQLPTEIWFTIFNHIPNYVEIIHLREVCKEMRWFVDGFVYMQMQRVANHQNKIPFITDENRFFAENYVADPDNYHKLYTRRGHTRHMHACLIRSIQPQPYFYELYHDPRSHLNPFLLQHLHYYYALMYSLGTIHINRSQKSNREEKLYRRLTEEWERLTHILKNRPIWLLNLRHFIEYLERTNTTVLHFGYDPNHRFRILYIPETQLYYICNRTENKKRPMKDFDSKRPLNGWIGMAEQYCCIIDKKGDVWPLLQSSEHLIPLLKTTFTHEMIVRMSLSSKLCFQCGTNIYKDNLHGMCAYCEFKNRNE